MYNYSTNLYPFLSSDGTEWPSAYLGVAGVPTGFLTVCNAPAMGKSSRMRGSAAGHG